MAGTTLTLTAQAHGFSAGVMGSCKLHKGLTADLDTDGRMELRVPNENGPDLGGIRRTADVAEVAWIVPLGVRISTNLATATLSDGTLAIETGRSDGVPRLWLL